MLQLKKLSWWHDEIINWMIQNPGLRLKDAAAHFDVHPAYLYRIVNTPMFRELLAQRKLEHFSNVSRSVIEGVSDLTKLTLETIEERIVSERESISLEFLSETLKTTLKAMGMGGRGPGGNTNVFIGGANEVNFPVPAHVIERAKGRIYQQYAQGSQVQESQEPERLPAP